MLWLQVFLKNFPKYALSCGAMPLIFYDEDKREYYAALQQYDEAEELDMLYHFLNADEKDMGQDIGERRQ